jgi:membrane-bound lytic murein transglycosylase A
VNIWIVALAMISFHAFSFETTPTVRLNQSLGFADDLNFVNLDLAIDRQLSSYESQGLPGDISFGTKVYPKKVLKESLILLKELVEIAKQCQQSQDREVPNDNCLDNLNRDLNEKFAIYTPVPKKNEAGYKTELTTKYTSYYSPDLTGSRTPTERFKRPIYRMPKEASLQNFSRVEIDYKGALAGKGYEIFWVEDSFFDLYLLHVQGGGRINIINPDGTKEVKYLSYDGKNSQSFKMIYHYLVNKGYLKPENASVPNQRKFLQENPDKEEEVFGSCPSYVYFKESDHEPVGLDNIPLTENRSLAMDSKVYKTTGIINFVKTKKVSHVDENGSVVKVPFSRFFIGQDTGGAIKGNARCDLYFGYGPLAELTAYNMNEMGEQYFLIKK